MAIYTNPFPGIADTCNALTVYHNNTGDDNIQTDFHVIAACQVIGIPLWDFNILLDWDPDNQPPPLEVQPVQIAAARLFRAYPELLSALCTLCRGTIDHPRHVLWNISQGERGQYVFPACWWNGITGIPAWSPDQAELLMI